MSPVLCGPVACLPLSPKGPCHLRASPSPQSLSPQHRPIISVAPWGGPLSPQGLCNLRACHLRVLITSAPLPFPPSPQGPCGVPHHHLRAPITSVCHLRVLVTSANPPPIISGAPWGAPPSPQRPRHLRACHLRGPVGYLPPHTATSEAPRERVTSCAAPLRASLSPKDPYLPSCDSTKLQPGIHKARYVTGRGRARASPRLSALPSRYSTVSH